MQPEDAYRPPVQPVFPEEPPGAKASRILGVTAIIAAFTCLGGPLALVLGVVGAVLAAKANRLGRENPDAYQAPTGMGFVTSIIGATLGGVASLVLVLAAGLAIPSAMARQRADRGPSLQERQVQIGDEARALRDGFRGPDGRVDADRLMAELIHRDGEHPNLYTGAMEKLEFGEHPSSPGRISVCQGYSSPYQGRNVPTIFIRALPLGGRREELTWIVRLE